MKDIVVLFLLVLFNLSFPQGITLRDTTNQYDYIIITVPEFVQACQTFKQHKESYNGFNVLIVDTGQIYSEFNSDSLPQNNIREFISYVGTHWQEPNLKYILFVGTNDQIPSFDLQMPMPPYFNPYHKTDYNYGININTDDTLTLSFQVGRIPAKTNIEVNSFFSKVIHYENINTSQSWFNNSLFIYEDDQMFDFDYFCFTLSSLMPLNIYPKYYTNADTSINFGNKDSILNYINNQGAAIMFYEGHLSDSMLINRDYFNINDIAGLNNFGKYFITLFTGGQYATLDSNNSIHREMLIRQNGGSIASIGSSGLVYWTVLRSIHMDWVNRLYNENDLTLGKLLQLYNLPNIGTYYYMKKSINLLGDPSLKLKYDATVNVSESRNEIPNEFVLHSNYPNPFNPSTKISWQTPVAGSQSLKVYDVIGNEVASLVNEYKNAGSYEVEFNASHLSSGIYFYTLRSGDFVQTRKMILLK
jgi:hypothetical protein